MVVATQDLLKNFNPNEHITPISTTQGKKDYLPVQWRLVWFRAVCPEGKITTEVIHLDLITEFTEPVYEKGKWELKKAPGMAIFRAVVEDGKGASATGTKSEKRATFVDFIEKAETGAIGRALAALGYGTQFTGDEWDEAHRIVDSPVDKPDDKGGQKAGAKQPQAMGDSPASQQQRSSIVKHCDALGKSSPLTPQTTFEEAKTLIQQLTTEQKEARQKQQQPAPTNNTQEITAASLRVRIAEIKPRMKDEVTLFTLETLYTAIMHRPYPGDNTFPIGERARINRQLDEIKRLHEQAEQPATA